MKLVKFLKKIKKYVQCLGIYEGLIFTYHVFTQNTNNIQNKKHNSSIKLRSNSTDLLIYEQIFFDKNYSIDWEKYISNPKVIIDGGANIGLFSILMADKFKEATLYALEPDKANFEILSHNTKDYPKIHCLNKGIWNEDTHLKISDKYNMGNWGLVLEETTLTENTTPVIKISTLMSDNQIQKIDILKLDIETSEKQVFSKNYSEWLPKVKVLVVEVHDWVENGCGQAVFKAINECIENYSYLICGENTIIINNDL
ncbi:MAG TPA: FkbM family methyltransferase [Saprospiraceae bacterium]|nr:FkbM family methyltransferase [Saprospiraceae bacterium]